MLINNEYPVFFFIITPMMKTIFEQIRTIEREKREEFERKLLLLIINISFVMK